MEPNKTKEELLLDALEARKQEVLCYQINIDNYTLALEEIANLSIEDRAEIASFAEMLRSQLASEILEQKKAKIMLTVLQKRVRPHD